jgi:hypothetical protein
MESAKLIKSSRLFFFVLIVFVSHFGMINCSKPVATFNVDEIKKIGYLSPDRSDSTFEVNEGIIVKLNNHEIVDYVPTNAFYSDAPLSKISTTLIPNKDLFLSQKNWILPEVQKNNFNYFSIENENKKDSFCVAIIDDFDDVSDGYPVLFVYVDSSGYFSSDSGIYVPGISANPKNIKNYGNYAMRGKEWERKVYFQLFQSNGDLIDQGWAGSRIHGNLTRAAPQKSLRFYAREEYGKSNFETPFIDSNKIERFILRTPFASNHELMYKDAMLSEVALDLGMDAMKSTPLKVYLNGEYWGYFNYRNRIDSRFFSEKYAIDTLDYLDMWARAKYGSAVEYKKTFKWLLKNDLRISENYDSLISTMDLNNYTRYLLIELFFANKDWPHNNVRFWRSSQLDNKWRWVIYDLDACGRDSADMAMFIIKKVEKKRNNWATAGMIGLLANESFYKNYINEYQRLSQNILNVDVLKSRADSLYELYEDLIPAQSKRWHYPSSPEKFEEMHTNFLLFLEYRDAVFIEEMNRLHNFAKNFQEKKFGKLD